MLNEIIRNLLLRSNDDKKISKDEDCVLDEREMIGKTFKKIKLLVYTDSRGLDIVKDKSYKNYVEKLEEIYDVDKVICPRKWTTCLDFLEYYDSVPNKSIYDAIVAHVGIVDFSPRPFTVAKKIFNLKRKMYKTLFPGGITKKHFSEPLYNEEYEGEKTTSLYSLEMAEKYLIPRFKSIPNLIWINSNSHILKNKGNYFKDRPKNIDNVSKYNDLFTRSLLNVVDVSEWNSEKVSRCFYDGLHPNSVGNDNIFDKTVTLINLFLKCSGSVVYKNLVGNDLDVYTNENIKREDVKDKPLFILASGPSLNMVDVRVLKNCYTMSFNRSYIAFNDWGFEPTYFVGLDTVVNYDNRKDYRKLIRNSSINRFFFCKDKSYQKELSSKKVDFVDIEDDPYHPDLNFNTRLRVGNSGLFGLQIAIEILGFREIYLIGCDANYNEEVPGTEIINGLYVSKSDEDNNHFRSDYYGEGTVYNKPGSMKWHYTAWKSFFDRFVKSKYLGVNIYNLSPISRLDFYKKTDFKEIVKNINRYKFR